MTTTQIAPPDALDGKTMTAEEYLAMERTGIREFQGKYELFNQKTRFMAGASNAHNKICTNLVTLINNFLWANFPEANLSQSDMKVVSFLDYKNYFYPDIVCVVSDMTFDDRRKDVLINPTLIIEVLSDETELFDRGDKFRSYRQIESLKEYVLVSQYERRIDSFFKTDDGNWHVAESVETGEFPLFSLPFSLKIDHVYRQMSF